MADAVERRERRWYCRRCGYMLHGLVDHRCPECGTTFDPADAGSYRTSPLPGSAGIWIGWLNLALCAVFIVALPVLLGKAALFLGWVVCSGWSILPYVLLAYLAHRSRHSIPLGVTCAVAITLVGSFHALLTWDIFHRPPPDAQAAIALAILPIYIMIGIAVAMAAVVGYQHWRQKRA